MEDGRPQRFDPVAASPLNKESWMASLWDLQNRMMGMLMRRSKVRGRKVRPMPARKKCSPGFNSLVHMRFGVAKRRSRNSVMQPERCRCGWYVTL
jgi:hypothetical protein